MFAGAVGWPLVLTTIGVERPLATLELHAVGAAAHRSTLMTVALLNATLAILDDHQVRRSPQLGDARTPGITTADFSDRHTVDPRVRPGSEESGHT